MKNKVPFKTSISEEIAVTLDRPINFEKKFHCLILLTENKPIGNLKKLYVSGKLQNLEKVKKNETTDGSRRACVCRTKTLHHPKNLQLLSIFVYE